MVPPSQPTDFIIHMLGNISTFLLPIASLSVQIFFTYFRKVFQFERLNKNINLISKVLS